MTDVGKKISVLSFLAMIGVVYIHHNAVGTIEPAPWNAFLQAFLTRGLTDWAVPFFFVVSGFWFTRGRYVTGGMSLKDFYAQKARTLLVPYVLWAMIGAVICMPVVVFNNHVNGNPILARTFLGQDSVFGSLDHLLGLVSNGPAGNLALWYVRTLLVFFVLAPLWKTVLRAGRWLPLAVGLGLVLVHPETWIPSTGLKTGSFGWLFLGMGLVEEIAANRRLPRGLAVASLVAWVGLSAAKASGHELCPQLIPLAGMAGLWSIADWAPWQRDWMRPTFWVYCLHGALAAYFLNGSLYVFGKSDVVMASVMLIAPWANIGFCLLAARIVRRGLPRAYACLTGGRA